MKELLIFNFILIGFAALGLWLAKKYIKTQRGKTVLLLAVSVFTILFHYSTLLFKLITGGDAIGYLRDTRNLIMPIYPCNVVMWSALIFALIRNKKSKAGEFFADYLFWFGVISTLVGMFANVDFISNPTLTDYENVKSIGAHATLLFNVLLLPLFGYTGVNVKRNTKNIVIAIIMMAIIGLYCNMVFHALVSYAEAYDVNSMFLIHSPFEGLDFLTYPIIALIGIPTYFALFVICDTILRKRGERFIDKLKRSKKSANEDESLS